MNPLIVTLMIPALVIAAWNFRVSRMDYWDKAPLHIFGSLFAFIPGAILALIFQAVFCEKQRSCSEIISIGGCSRSGLCGVRLESGKVDYANLPVLGSQVCEEWLVWK